jgi:hypothetical protein
MGNGTATGMGFEYVTWIPSADKIEKIFLLQETRMRHGFSGSGLPVK